MPLLLAAPQARLHSGAPWWLVRDGLGGDPVGSPPPSEADVVVVGAGITGALVADALARAGLGVLVIDRRRPAAGSTGASTALLQYELDTELVALTRSVGEHDAVAAYQRSAWAIAELRQLTESLPHPCGFAPRSSIYLASRRTHTRRLQREQTARRRAGLPAEFCSDREIAAAYQLPSHGALRTDLAAVVDPVALTLAVLARAERYGARLVSWTTALHVDSRASGIVVHTDRGDVRAGRVVLACGYELPPGLDPAGVRLHSTYALVTEPADAPSALAACIVWESARPYSYLRADGRRLLIGGMDIRHRDAATRDRLLPARTRLLERELRRLVPAWGAITSSSWAGTFAETADGMPVIGPLPGWPSVYYALGYGGNGITFSVVAADILRDLCLGKSNPFAHIFRPDR